jgi:hypothetical protein
MEWLMSALGGSQERRPHRIGACGGAGPDCGSGSDSATSGELAAVARGELADQLRLGWRKWSQLKNKGR